VLMVSAEESAALELAIGNVCSSSRRLIYVEHMLPEISSALALHASPVQRYRDGCIAVLHFNENLWSDVMHVYRQRGFDNLEE